MLHPHESCISIADIASVMAGPVRSIVTFATVTKCRSSTVTKLVNTVKSIPAGSKNLLVALALHYVLGQTFSLAQAHDALNTYLISMSLPRSDMASVVCHAQQLLELSLLNNQLPGNRSGAKSTLNHISPQKVCIYRRLSYMSLIRVCVYYYAFFMLL